MLVFFRLIRSGSLICWFALGAAGCASQSSAFDVRPSPATAGRNVKLEKIVPYQARFGRHRPVIAVVGENRGTELTDYIVPFGVLTQSDVADVISLSTAQGPIKTFTDMGKPAFQIASQATVSEFDTAYPDGADYVVVPAAADSAELRAWVTTQIGKGATIVSICNGAMVVAMTGLMDGHRATAHWSSEGHRLEMHRNIQWVKNARYVADRNWISSAGVSAAMPTSIALVEAIAGPARAAALAQELGMATWDSSHNSDFFQPTLGSNLMAFAQTLYFNRWFHTTEKIGVPVALGVNEMTLALTVDAYSSTGRSQAYIVAGSATPIQTAHGLTIIPDLTSRDGPSLSHELPALDGVPPGRVLARVLTDIEALYGKTSAYGVALLLEYPWDIH
ncbi:MAG: DJ-1/PfpI family protein [Pseudomonadota bacterium]|nr:DJ-1/PfpI family protein [Pseudomonadota bacterium]